MDVIYLCYNMSMDVVNEIEILGTEEKDWKEKCQRVKCNAIYDAITSSLKL